MTEPAAEQAPADAAAPAVQEQEQQEQQQEQPSFPLVLATGQEFVRSTLFSGIAPREALRRIREAVRLTAPAAPLLLDFLKELDVPLDEAHRRVTRAAVEETTSRLPNLPQEELRNLVRLTAPYLAMPALRSVPLAAMAHLTEGVPSGVLAAITQALTRKEGRKSVTIDELPDRVRRQAWEVTPILLLEQVLPPTASYAAEDHAAELGRVQASLCGGDAGWERGKLRRTSKALGQLVDTVGASTTLYESIMGMVRRAYAGVRVQNDTKPVLSAPAAEGALALTFWPALRTQLLMKLHETGRGATEGDRRKRLAWALDACVKVGTVGDRYIIELGEGLREALEPQKRKAPASAAPASKRARGGAGGPSGAGAGVPLASSAGTDDLPTVVDGAVRAASAAGSSSIERRLLAIADAGIVLADAPVAALLGRTLLGRVRECIEGDILPTKDASVRLLLLCLALSVSARKCAKEYAKVSITGELAKDAKAAFAFDEECLRDMLGLVGELEVEAMLRDEDDLTATAAAADATDVDVARLSDLVNRNRCARRIALLLLIERLRSKDGGGAAPLIRALEGSMVKPRNREEEGHVLAALASCIVARANAAAAAPPTDEDPAPIPALLDRRRALSGICSLTDADASRHTEVSSTIAEALRVHTSAAQRGLERATSMLHKAKARRKEAEDAAVPDEGEVVEEGEVSGEAEVQEAVEAEKDASARVDAWRTYCDSLVVR